MRLRIPYSYRVYESVEVEVEDDTIPDELSEEEIVDLLAGHDVIFNEDDEAEVDVDSVIIVPELA